MCKTYDGRGEEFGFQSQKQRSRNNPAITVTDLEFADPLMLNVEQAWEVLSRLEQKAVKIGSYCNAKKTELLVFNHEAPVEVKV